MTRKARPSAEVQAAFLGLIERLLSGGQFVATSKYALPIALADLAVGYGTDGIASRHTEDQGNRGEVRCREGEICGGCQISQFIIVIRSALCGLPNGSPIFTARILAASMNDTDGGDVVNQTNDGLWLSFEALAKTYPHDDGVRMTADLTRWLLEERERIQLPVPPIIDKVVRAVAQELEVQAAGVSPEAPETSG